MSSILDKNGADGDADDATAAADIGAMMLPRVGYEDEMLTSLAIICL